MNTKKAISDFRLKILCVLADNKGHSAKEIEQKLDAENKNRVAEKYLRKKMTLIYDRKIHRILGYETAKPKKQFSYKSIYKGNLSKELHALIFADHIYRRARDKKRGPGERGHKTEYIYFIKNEAHNHIDKILMHELDKEKFELRGALRGLSDWPLHYDYALMRFFQWRRSKNINEFDDYIEAALASAENEKVEVGRPYRARIPMIPEVAAGGKDEKECREELRSNLEKWIALEINMGQQMPPIGGHSINLLSSEDTI